jgi:hypothetical protein
MPARNPSITGARTLWRTHTAMLLENRQCSINVGTATITTSGWQQEGTRTVPERILPSLDTISAERYTYMGMQLGQG